MDYTSLTPQSVSELLSKQKAFFASNATRSYSYRIEQLNRLYQAILNHQGQLESALYQDLGKSNFESYTSEIGLILSGITHTKKHLKQWMKPQRVSTPLHIFPASSRIESVPFGSVLIMGPYNYPFQLTMEPLVAAMAAGNCAVIAPSELTPNVAQVIQTLINETFSPEYVCCVDGGIENNTVLLHSRFDYIFFTGSTTVGKIVMKAAAEHLIPVTLELGGKSPVIVDNTACLAATCERIAWGKFMNAGQTCVAPDYILVDERIQDAFIQELIAAIHRFYGENMQDSPDFGRIVNQRHMQRLTDILQQDKSFIRFGGHTDTTARYIEPTLLCPDSTDAACMQQELFGPLLPIFSYRTLDEALEQINQGETPLALYIFSENFQTIETILSRTQSGGVCINDTISHILNPNLPFGGKGYSGMGSYHGQAGFATFSHKRSILKKSTRIKIRLAFPPYSTKKYDGVRRFLR